MKKIDDELKRIHPLENEPYSKIYPILFKILCCCSKSYKVSKEENKSFNFSKVKMSLSGGNNFIDNIQREIINFTDSD